MSDSSIRPVRRLTPRRLLTVSHFLIDYPFADCLFPQSLEVVEHIKQWGPAVILSDGDVVFQPHKVERSGLLNAVNGNVLIYLHVVRRSFTGTNSCGLAIAFTVS